MSTVIVQDSASLNTSGPRFRPFASTNHHVTKGRYITSNDPRGYIPVYEYPLNGQWIMMDIDDGYILWTGIWKALGNSKADIVKMVDSQPDLATLIRRVRGGYLKIQGTWMPHEVALRLARRVAWPIRDDLVPLFGPTFPSTCLSPGQPGYGQIIPSGPGRRRVRRSTQRIAPSDGHAVWDASSSRFSPTGRAPALPPVQTASYTHLPQSHSTERTLPSPSSPRWARYTPYPSVGHSVGKSIAGYSRRSLDGLLDIPSMSLNSPTLKTVAPLNEIYLPPIGQPVDRLSLRRGSSVTEPIYALPPISALEDLRGVNTRDNSPAAVLKRLREQDSDQESAVSSLVDEPETTIHSHSKKMRSFSASNFSSAVPLCTSQPRPLLSGPPLVYPCGTSRSYPSSSILEQQRPPRPSLSMDNLHHPSMYCSRDDDVSTCEPSPISPATPPSPAISTSSLRPLLNLSGPALRDPQDVGMLRVASISPPAELPEKYLQLPQTLLYRNPLRSLSSSPSPTSNRAARPW